MRRIPAAFVFGLYVQGVVHGGDVGQIKRAVLQALILAHPVQAGPQQPVLAVRQAYIEDAVIVCPAGDNEPRAEKKVERFALTT